MVTKTTFENFKISQVSDCETSKEQFHEINDLRFSQYAQQIKTLNGYHEKMQTNFDSLETDIRDNVKTNQENHNYLVKLIVDLSQGKEVETPTIANEEDNDGD